MVNEATASTRRRLERSKVLSDASAAPEAFPPCVARSDSRREARMKPIEIVPPEGVTPAWMTEALQSRGVDATVSDIRMESVGTGQVAEARRFHLKYRG